MLSGQLILYRTANAQTRGGQIFHKTQILVDTKKNLDEITFQFKNLGGDS